MNENMFDAENLVGSSGKSNSPVKDQQEAPKRRGRKPKKPIVNINPDKMLHNNSDITSLIIYICKNLLDLSYMANDKSKANEVDNILKEIVEKFNIMSEKINNGSQDTENKEVIDEKEKIISRIS